jgi:hypothetical protein
MAPIIHDYPFSKGKVSFLLLFCLKGWQGCESHYDTSDISQFVLGGQNKML